MEKFMEMLRTSAIMRQQVYQLVTIVLGFVGAQIDMPFLQENSEVIVDSVLRGLGGAIAIYTMITRAFKPAPNLSESADKKELELIANGTMPAAKATSGVLNAARAKGVNV